MLDKQKAVAICKGCGGFLLFMEVCRINRVAELQVSESGRAER